MSEFQVNLEKKTDDSYSIEVGYGLWSKMAEEMKTTLGQCRVAVITDTNVARIFGNRMMESLEKAGIQAELFSFPAGEEYKTRETKAFLEDKLLEKGYGRDSGIIALGGGTVSDLAGFLAGTYCRGIPYVTYATTLLAAADASIGGKTAVDTPTATNMIGLFYQPKKVYLDLDTWNTLPKREISNGLAETIKHACLGDVAFFDYLEEHMTLIRQLDRSVCQQVAEANCRIKYTIVCQDEGENGLREGLNLGHTLGRALETVSGYELRHGEAVSIGLVAQLKLAEARGFVCEKEVKRVEQLLLAAGLPITLPEGTNKEKLLDKLYTDKKVRKGSLRFVLQKGIGNLAVAEDGSLGHKVEREEVLQLLLNF